jgi:hypothetical protein
MTPRILNAALAGDEWSASRPGHSLPPGDDPPVPVGGWVGPRAYIDLSEKSLLPLFPVIFIHLMSSSYIC